MEYKNFMRLMQSQEHSGPETVSDLQEMLAEFPYFQSAHILLAKSMKEQEHLRFERQLKLAAAYAPERSVLYSMLQPKSKTSIIQEPVADETISPFIIEKESEEEFVPVIVENDNPFVDTGAPLAEVEPIAYHREEIPIEDSPEIPEPRYAMEVEEAVRIETSLPSLADDSNEVLSSDPREVLRRRLAEILGNPDDDFVASEKQPEVTQKKDYTDQPVQSSIVEVTEVIQPEEYETQKSSAQAEELQLEISDSGTDIFTGTERNEKTDVLPDDLSVPMDTVEKMELEYALENSILASLENLPPLDKAEHTESEIEETERILHSSVAAGREDLQNKRMSFTAWLTSLKSESFGNFEEVHADDEITTSFDKNPQAEISSAKNIDEKEQVRSQDKFAETIHQDPSRDLIEKFIATEPKIVPSKAEFYSPVTQAKRSIEEHDDLVSETLAGIYRIQGNLPKARLCYEKLSLFYPGKSAYFAALIKEIDEELTKLNKEDL